MEPLQELFDLYEAMKAQKKPALRDEGEPAVGNPDVNYDEDPIIAGKNGVDELRLQGVPASDAHEKIHGQVDTSDVQSKAEFAKTLGRVQQDGDRSNIHIDKDAEFKSIMAKDEEIEKKLGTDQQKMKTPLSREMSSAQADPEQVDTKEEVDYNEDVTYLQTYGRA